MKALHACIHMTAKRPSLPDALAWLRDFDMMGPIKLWDADGETELAVDLWPPTMVAILEAAGRLEGCQDADELATALAECLLFGHAAISGEQLARRCRELAIEMLKFGLQIKNVAENN